MSAPRPFRHLCPEADERDAMTDDEFWARVARNLNPFPEFDEPSEPDAHDLDVAISAPPCEVCGSTGACGYDSEGRALIHATEEEDDR